MAELRKEPKGNGGFAERNAFSFPISEMRKRNLWKKGNLRVYPMTFRAAKIIKELKEK